MEVEKIQISISADTSEAIKAYKKLADAMQKLNTLADKDFHFDKVAIQINLFAKATENAIRPLKELADSLEKIQKFSVGGETKAAKAVKVAAKATKNEFETAEPTEIDIEEPISNPSGLIEPAGEEAEESGRKAEKGAKGWKKFGEQFGKIAYYRLIRRILSDISNRISEGSRDLYTFMNASDNPTSRNTVSQLDSISTSFMQLGSTIAITLTSITTLLEPVIRFMSTEIVELLNVINALIAKLKGSTTYTKVNTEAIKKWSETVNHAVQGFDELNVLSSSMSTSPFEIFDDNASVDETLENLDKELLKLAGLITAYEGIKTVVGLVRNAFLKKNSALKEQSELTATELGLVPSLSTAYKKAVNPINLLSSAIATLGVTAVFSDLLKNIDNLGEKLPTQLAPIGEAFESQFDSIEQKAESFADKMQTIFSGIKVPEVGVETGAPLADKKNETATETAKTYDSIANEIAEAMANADPLGVMNSSVSNAIANAAGAPTTSKGNKGVGYISNAVALGDGSSFIGSVIANAIGKHFESSTGMSSNAFGDSVNSLIDDITPDSPKEFFEALSNSLGKLGGALWKSAIFHGASSLVPGFATGGFVSSGELFYARENGIPEMVGHIGNRTAVANNDQITEAIASAVYEAITEAQGNNNVNVTLEGDARKLFTVVQREARSYTKATGNYAF